MKVVIFGAGKFYQEKKEEFLSYKDIEQIAFIDNNKELYGTYINDIPIFPVEQIDFLSYDVILLMSAKAGEMKKQLVKIGISNSKIWFWEKFRSEKNKGIFHFYCGQQGKLLIKKKILIITTDLGYNGGTLAAVYAAMELQKRMYYVMLAAPGGNPVFIEEMEKAGLNIVVCQALPYLYQKELAFIDRFDVVIVNVFQMIVSACETSKIKPVLWWIHEPVDVYVSLIDQFQEYTMKEKMEKINIYAVSRIAQKNFNAYFPERIAKTLAYGIPDEKRDIEKEEKSGKMIFALIGNVTPIKGQDILLEAVKKLDNSEKSNMAFWLIGKIQGDSYYNNIREEATKESSVNLLGEMTRKEIRDVYEKIDVLVCTSWQDSLPIVVTEAMMHGKICIVSDSTGMADYISNGQNGFIFKTGDVEDLSDKMKWVFHNKEKLQQIGVNARVVYEKYFTMDYFGDQLETVLDLVEESWEAGKKDLGNETL